MNRNELVEQIEREIGGLWAYKLGSKDHDELCDKISDLIQQVKTLEKEPQTLLFATKTDPEVFPEEDNLGSTGKYFVECSRCRCMAAVFIKKPMPKEQQRMFTCSRCELSLMSCRIEKRLRGKEKK